MRVPWGFHPQCSRSRLDSACTCLVLLLGGGGGNSRDVCCDCCPLSGPGGSRAPGPTLTLPSLLLPLQVHVFCMLHRLRAARLYI